MKKVNDYLSQFKQDIDYDKMIDRFMDDIVVNKFIMDHDLTREQIIKSSHIFLAYLDEMAICRQCESLKQCRLNTVGYTPHLAYKNHQILIEYSRCRFNTRDGLSNINALYIPKKIFEASLEDMDLIGESRKRIHQYIHQFLKHHHKESFMKAMYISGEYGTGKTYILAAIANELAKENYHVTFAYYPDLTRELKSSIGSGTLENKIHELKATDMLFLDDIGGEYFSKFIRDEILGSVLQHRLLDNKPTFFSSNFPLKELVNVMKDSNSTQETIAAFRIVERIKRMTEEFVLKDKARLS